MTIELGTIKNSEHSVKVNTELLSTHTAIFGSTGSGKTGLVLNIAEEVMKQKVPIVMLDIKGDLTNIMFQRHQHDAEFKLLTPGSYHGNTVNIFSKISDVGNNSQAISSLLKKLGIKDVSPISSRHHSYLSAIIQHRVESGLSCDLESLVDAIMDPGFERLGVLQVEQVFNNGAKSAFATQLNNLVASPHITPWTEGVDLDIDRLNSSSSGKTPVTIYSVAHIDDEDEKTFAISFLLEALKSWMKAQEGTKKLSMLFVVDECFGLLPPHPRNPVTKAPIMSLLKQGRAFGLGVVLATQNPLDIDYKALSNCHTCIAGKLQTHNDRKRVLEIVGGLAAMNRGTLEYKLTKLETREFIFVRASAQVEFKVKEVSCDMRGPIPAKTLLKLRREGFIPTIS